MEQFGSVLTETLVIVTRLGIPLVILFLIGHMMRSHQRHS